jgi:hypothetical protein
MPQTLAPALTHGQPVRRFTSNATLYLVYPARSRMTSASFLVAFAFGVGRALLRNAFLRRPPLREKRARC